MLDLLPERRPMDALKGSQVLAMKADVTSVITRGGMVRVLLITGAVLGLGSGCDSNDSNKEQAGIRPRLTVTQVIRAFKEEGVPLKNIRGESNAGAPLVLAPANRAQVSLFAVSVYSPDDATGPLGLRVANHGFEIERILNVVVGYARSGQAATPVRAAIERLRKQALAHKS